MKHFLKIAEGLDVAPILADLDAHPELWDSIRFRKDAPGSAHTRMSDIWVRYNDPAKFGGELKAMSEPHVPVWFPAWHALPSLRPLVMALTAAVQGEMIGGVLVTRVPPGEGIAPHADIGWHVEQYDKFYISLKSEPGAAFGCDHDGVREELEPKPGDCWLFDNRKLHWVENRSAADRITLIVCIRTEMFGREPWTA